MAGGNKVGILTGGGDVPGLNPVIKSVVYGITAQGREVIGLRKGWESLTYMNGPTDPAYVWPLTRENTYKIERTGGTVLHTSRTNPRKIIEAKLPKTLTPEQIKKLPFDGKVYNLTSVVIENLEKLGISTLVAIGGDDTLSFADALSKAGFPTIAVPKTMDNDVRGTEYCIGFSTALTRARDAINRQRTTIGSHERVGIFRIFGRDAGFTALYTAYISAIRCLIPEYRFDLEKVCELMKQDKKNNPSNYALLLASEGAMWTAGEVKEYGEADAFGHRKKVDIGEALAEEIKKRTGFEMVISDLTYDLRGGEPDVIDQMIGLSFGNIAVQLIGEKLSGRMVGLENGKYVHVPIPDATLGPRKVDIARLYDTNRYRPSYASKLDAPIFFSGF
jgi:ATP-dependent phosphofructokinase / diphosphate-dependent phosphofructokinase